MRPKPAAPGSRGVCLPLSVLSLHGVARHWFALPPRPWRAEARWTPRCSAEQLPSCASVGGSSAHRLCSPSKPSPVASARGPEGTLASSTIGDASCPKTFSLATRTRRALPARHLSWGSSPLQRNQREESFSRSAGHHKWWACCRQRPCLGRRLSAFRVSHPLDGLLLFAPRRLVSSD